MSFLRKVVGCSIGHMWEKPVKFSAEITAAPFTMIRMQHSIRLLYTHLELSNQMKPHTLHFILFIMTARIYTYMCRRIIYLVRNLI